jgi:hypothetical protein
VQLAGNPHPLRGDCQTRPLLTFTGQLSRHRLEFAGPQPRRPQRVSGQPRGTDHERDEGEVGRVIGDHRDSSDEGQPQAGERTGPVGVDRHGVDGHYHRDHARHAVDRHGQQRLRG